VRMANCHIFTPFITYVVRVMIINCWSIGDCPEVAGEVEDPLKWGGFEGSVVSECLWVTHVDETVSYIEDSEIAGFTAADVFKTIQGR